MSSTQIPWLVPHSVPAQALRKAQASGFLLGSDDTFAELADVLLRPKFDKYVSQASRRQFLIDYQNAILRVDILRTVFDCRDTKDNKFLDVALNANAAYLVSGDEDLLVLHPYGDVQIVTAANFMVADLFGN